LKRAYNKQRCGLSLNASRRTNVSSLSHLKQNPQRLGLVSISDLYYISSPVSVSKQNISILAQKITDMRLVKTFCADTCHAQMQLDWY